MYKKFLKEAFFVLTITALLFILLEIFISGIFFLSGSHYFSTKTENEYKSFKIVEDEKIQVAVFGGSSSAGSFSPLSFADLLSNTEFTNKSFRVTNYAENGAPFSGFQSELIKTVMSNYDIIVIYSGHNELWNQVYKREGATSFENGQSTPRPEDVHSQFRQNLSSINDTVNSEYSVNRYIIINHSRVYYLIFRLFERLSPYLSSIQSSDVENKQIYPKRFYYKNSFILPEERERMLNLYKKNLKEIAVELKDNQKLVISTVMSNDLSPPLADFYPGDDIEYADLINKKTEDAYLALSQNKNEVLRKTIEILPKGPHKSYLEGMLCLFDNLELQGLLPRQCLLKLSKARELDGFPVRVLPKINQFIRNFKHDNVVVVDPVKDALYKSNGLKEYKEYFVDFQHPSILGHAIIAKNILRGLFPLEGYDHSYKVDQCSLEVKEGGKLKVFDSTVLNEDYDKCKRAYDANINWILGFIKIQPIPYQYEYYLDKSRKIGYSLQK